MKKLIFCLLLINCSKDNLKDLNNVEMPKFEQLQHYSKSEDSTKILIIGNSITSHPIIEKIGWHHKSGMAATKEERDYVHVLFNRIKDSTDKNIVLRYFNFSEFERFPESLDASNIRFEEIYKFQPNIVIYQLGDNTSIENQKEYQKKSIDILSKVTGDKYILSPFFNFKWNYQTAKNISNEVGAKFLDISSTNDYRAKFQNDYPSDEKDNWKVDGIGLHPGDLGMKKISDIIYEGIYQK